MHALEKILAKAAKKDSVRAGEIVNCEVDMAGVNDLYLQTIRSFYEMGGEKVFAPQKTIVFLDHYAPASTIIQADNQKQFRAFCRDQGIDKLMDINQGVCHQIMADKGFSKPGQLIVITDSHTTTNGTFGAFGTGVGATELAVILRTGSLWFRVPEVIRINLEGELKPGVYAKDVILYIIGKMGADYAVYKAVEFTGSLLNQLSMSERMALCNMTTEMGAKTSYIQPDEITFSYLKDKAVDYEVFETDADYQYSAELTFDVTDLGTQIAAPHSVDNVFPLSEFEGKPVDQAFIGTCTGGRVQDLAAAAYILKGRRINPSTRLLVVPASSQVLLESIEKGYIQTLVDAGATLVTPGCAACLGTHEGMIAEGEVCITSSNRNFPGRMGHSKAEIFLASPASVAAAALNGHITDPARYLVEREDHDE
ncbi:MAG: 3-isopropylmalate dehydratase large subunit [Geosporobacter ferrireducens]|nr:3-isopropylmalate dehydratase large subunit [Geosporobacter ferrireducens]